MALARVLAATARSARPTDHRTLAVGWITALLVAGLVVPAATFGAGPSPEFDYVTTAEDTPATGNVLANDTDPEGDPLTVLAFTPLTVGGTLVIVANGDLTFTPTADWNGSVFTTYTVSDGTTSHLGYVFLTVTPVNDDPVAVNDDVAGTEDTDLVLGAADLAGNDTDVDGDDLAVSDAGDATGGTVAFAAGSVTFTPDADLCGTAVGGFGYTVDDGNGGTDTATATVDIECVNDAPVAVDDIALIDQASGPADHDVLANDTDIEDDTLSLVSADVAPAAGAASVVGGKVRFTPLNAFKGEAVVTYVVTDGDLTDTGTLTVTVGPDETAPVAAMPGVAFGAGRVNETAPLAITWSATDSGVGVASYEVEVSVAGAAFAPVYTGSATTVTRLYPFGKSLVFRVRATDHEDNVSDWVSSATRTMVAYQAPGSTSIKYAGTWTNVNATSASGDRYRYTPTFGGRASLGFNGRAVLYVAPKTRPAGRVKVYVDGVLITRPTLASATTVPGVIIARKSWTTSSWHSIRIVNDSAGRRMNLDVFIVLK
jgi:hypothetical protein